ncbi:MAG: 50S ribosomal protein L23 [Candidatus Electryoneaceae bacterium]|nr:50S ribosomal protein L23 [Candidatus Electryoneaceae bacterium]
MKSSFKVLRRPVVTEKMTRLQEQENQYAFEVDPRANKIEIKRAVEERFEVQVEKVRTMNTSGKVKRLGRFTGRRPSWKKAIVTLVEGDTIDLLEGA